ncbi:hypothetical protein CH35J_007559 [Colletotrichum higginsianum]|uniref:Uncharacterized protein n=1 Tax=Colletotrichum higginsianum TaxID=80884 RepID=A0A4T0VYQ5_9PEZI|nr:hypothetical protein CH35J_007559 [Colletotrichum higginsianum]
MQLSTLIFSAGLMASGSVLGAPGAVAERSPVAESIANATALGVDVYGQIPADAVRVSDGSYTAEPGSQAWAWIRAQIDLPNTLETRNEIENRAALEKRQAANIGIGMFSQDWCQGKAAWFDNAGYNIHHISHDNMFSVGISYRGLRSNEQLDFSKFANNDLCGKYVFTAGQNTPVGCFNSQLINCFHLFQK